MKADKLTDINKVRQFSLLKDDNNLFRKTHPLTFSEEKSPEAFILKIYGDGKLEQKISGIEYVDLSEEAEKEEEKRIK